MKKQLKLLIIPAVIALVLGGLVLASSQYSVNRITESIDAIGKVTYSGESRKLIDAADERIAGLDPNLHLDRRIGNLDTLKSAKVTYVEQAIIRMYRAIRDKQDETVIREYYADAEEAFSHYLTEADIPLVHNWKDLTDAREKYGEKETAPGVTDQFKLQPAEPIELC